jgi:hypothetical protein
MSYSRPESMALQLGTGIIETRAPTKLAKLQAAMDKVLAELGWEQTYEGKAPPEQPPEDEATEFVLMANAEGALAIQVSEERVVRDLARMISSRLEGPFVVLTTLGKVFGRRSVEVTCRKFEVNGGEVEELPTMPTHTAEVTDFEHNELRQAENALRNRVVGANDSLLQAEGTAGFKLKKVLRYKRTIQVKVSSKRLGRLIEQIESCETFVIGEERGQPAVKVVLPGATSTAFLKPDEIAELEKALEGRPELTHRRQEPA